jgi:Fe-S-cluster-containing hydrogenase component 2
MPFHYRDSVWPHHARWGLKGGRYARGFVDASFEGNPTLKMWNDKDKVITVWTNVKRCGGCRGCEVACSYHHTKQCDPSQSSIRIHLDLADGSLDVLFLESCDLCANEENGPLCVQVCEHGVLELARMAEVVKSE